jgi:trans-aconitate methyltransferase
LFDTTTFRHLDTLGVAAGWRCWEVGAGAATVPAWLARRVGPKGHVLATDTDLTFLQSARDIPYELRRHDIGADPAPPEEFDLVHARLLLEHIPSRDAALHTMIEALRPGGWLLIESADPQLQPLAAPMRRVPPNISPTNSCRRAGRSKPDAPTWPMDARFLADSAPPVWSTSVQRSPSP